MTSYYIPDDYDLDVQLELEEQANTRKLEKERELMEKQREIERQQEILQREKENLTPDLELSSLNINDNSKVSRYHHDDQSDDDDDTIGQKRFLMRQDELGEKVRINNLYPVGISLVALHGSIKIYEPKTNTDFIELDAFQVPDGITIYKIDSSPPGVCNITDEKTMQDKLEIIEEIFLTGLRDNLKDDIRDAEWLASSIQSYMRNIYGGKNFFSMVTKHMATKKPTDVGYTEFKKAKYASNKFYTMKVFKGAGAPGKKKGEKGDIIYNKTYVSGGQPLGELDMNVTIIISDKQNDIYDSQINLDTVPLSYIVKTMIDLGKKDIIILDETCSIFNEEVTGKGYDERATRALSRSLRNIRLGGYCRRKKTKKNIKNYKHNYSKYNKHSKTLKRNIKKTIKRKK